jgi:tetratricopeptide (TPR) repeat protein
VHKKTRHSVKLLQSAGPAVADALARCDREIAGLLATRGQLHLVQGAVDEAAEDLSRALAYDSANALAYAVRGDLHELGGDADASKADRVKATSLDSVIEWTKSAGPRLESGYRVVILGYDNYGPIGCFPGNPPGFRQAVAYARSLSRDSSERFQVARQYDLGDNDFATALQEYHLVVREILRESPPDDKGSHQPGVWPECWAELPPEIPYDGHWPFWAMLLEKKAGGQSLTEREAIDITRSLERQVRNQLPAVLDPLVETFNRLPGRPRLLDALQDLSRQSPPTAKAVLRRLDETDDLDLGDLNAFVQSFNDAIRQVVAAVTSLHQDFLGGLAQTIVTAFTQDLRAFTAEEVLKAFAASPSAAVA